MGQKKFFYKIFECTTPLLGSKILKFFFHFLALIFKIRAQFNKIQNGSKKIFFAKILNLERDWWQVDQKFHRRAVSQFLACKWTQQLKIYKVTHFCLENDPPKMLLYDPDLCYRHVKILLTPAPTPLCRYNFPFKTNKGVSSINISFPFFKKKDGTDPIKLSYSQRFH